MRLTATIGAALLAEGIWQGDLRGAVLAMKPLVLRRELPTVLVVRDAAFEPESGRLSFDYGGIDILNRGDDARAIILAAAAGHAAAPTDEAPSGDQAFLSLLDGLSPAIRETGRDLLDRIRELDPGGRLEQRGRRFINRPDNFVALEPQTTLNQIIVHLRGLVSTGLRPVATQRGYSAFKVTGPGDIPEAGSALGRATRKF